ncbi:MAG TPA: hypothetical protein VG309_09215 [Rhizomicrobium sp.]|jgi:hypothetical protein|nr:hypothetical protein [Rhizomicrobium sp.]
MTIENAHDWAKELENKEISELMDMNPPDDLSEDDAESWQKVWLEAFRAKRTMPIPAPANDVAPVASADSVAARLLENQMQTSAKLVEYIAGYVSHNDTDPHVCMSFMDRMATMLRASASVGKVVSQLRGQISRSEQAIEVAYRGRGRG